MRPEKRSYPNSGRDVHVGGWMTAHTNLVTDFAIMVAVHRVSVVGNSGSGKSTLAATLAAHLDAPWIELDSIYHQPGPDCGGGIDRRPGPTPLSGLTSPGRS